jgi:hypothetical protein
MNFRVVVAKVLDRLALLWAAGSFGFLLLAAIFDWPLPEFLDQFDGESFDTLATLFMLVPTIACLLAADRLAPDAYLTRDRERLLRRLQRAKKRDGVGREYTSCHGRTKQRGVEPPSGPCYNHKP